MDQSSTKTTTGSDNEYDALTDDMITAMADNLTSAPDPRTTSILYVQQTEEYRRFLAKELEEAATNAKFWQEREQDIRDVLTATGQSLDVLSVVEDKPAPEPGIIPEAAPHAPKSRPAPSKG